ncbi:type III-A CRISPR-associated RAMP protein Csm4 [Anoxybacter fermentans]|uniref:CRISPR system Cms protein Csm4 n=1 Tax=Anoxybacter fermentans TaxID=1323375 RepID=A0A3S9SVW5_9FIRM|nr:type III-A CRISPR-associated RAMP protein Csm4 [Anoxybacter fermentans]AZR72424.1 type III-A CRISPR-associated RAMP protein Csm4 [Anoxybacter fermentans]
MKVVKLLIGDRAKFHFGNYKRELTSVFSSDSLFSAIINNYALLYPEKTEQIIDKFRKREYLISSCYLGIDFWNGEKKKKTIYFLIKPFWRIGRDRNEENDDDLRKRKMIKKLKYLSLNVYNDLLNAWNEEKGFFEYDLSAQFIIGNKFCISNQEVDDLNLTFEEKRKLADLNFIKEYSTPKVAVNRITNKSEAFYYENNIELSYKKIGDYTLKPFFYFLANQAFVENKEIRASLNLLCDEGLGGRRSMGIGQFQNCVYEDITGVLSHEGNKYISLSIVFPKKEEVDNVLSYNLVKRNGYIFSNGGRAFRKKDVRVMQEGSIFNCKVEGQFLDLKPEGFKLPHKVYLNGNSFLIGFGGGK